VWLPLLPATTLCLRLLITGFFDGTKINGRPAYIFGFGKDAFLLTDDHSGVVYYVYRKP
jgi:hypothetical protein